MKEIIKLIGCQPDSLKGVMNASPTKNNVKVRDKKLLYLIIIFN